MNVVRQFATTTCTALLALLFAGAAVAQQPAVSAVAPGKFPDKPVRIIVTVPPGGASDFVARTLSESFAKELGTPVLIENKAGANGTIASAFVARAPADGYTLLQAGISTHGIGPYFYDNLPYAPFKDLVPVGPIAEFPIILAVNAQLPVKSVAELIALAKTRPMSFASAGTGSAPHLSGELFKIETGLNLVHVPYKTAPAALAAVVGGDVALTFGGQPPAWPLVKADKLRALGITSAKRAAEFPDVAVIAESVPGYEVLDWNGFMVPAGTPPEVVARLNKELVAILVDDDLVRQLRAQGLNPAPGTPADFAAMIDRESRKWAGVAKDIKLKLD